MREISKSSGLTLLLLFSLAVTLAASSASAQFTHRLTRIVYDFDANGTLDADRVIAYNGAGEVTTTTYTYVGDGTPDLFNTEDNATTVEDGTFGYDANGLVTQATADRGFESFDTTLTFTAGELTRTDSAHLDGVGALISADYTLFSYTGGDLTQTNNFETGTNDFINSITLTYGAYGRPQTYDLTSPGIDIANTLAWRTDTRIAGVASVASGGFGTGTGTYRYDTNGLPLDEVWTITGFVGSLLTEFPGENYRKTYTYDGGNFKTQEEVDIGDNGSVEAILTFEWTAGSCNPNFIWAPNGRPNFIELPGLPYVPGTGALSYDNCGPYPLPEPSVPALLAAGVVALVAARRYPKSRCRVVA